MTAINLYIGCPEDNYSNDYLCLDINLSDGSDISAEQSDYLGSLSSLDFIEIFEGYCNRANYLSAELSIPVKFDLDSIVEACIENFDESVIKYVKELLREVRSNSKSPRIGRNISNE